MSASALPIAATGGPNGGEPIMTAAAERVQQLRALIARVEHPTAGATFASALDSAQSATAEPAATAGAYSSAVLPAGGYASTAPTATYTSAAPAGDSYASAVPAADTYTSAATAGDGYASAVPTTVAYSSAAPATASGAPAAYTPLIDSAAARFGLDPAILYGLIQQESGFDPSARSGAGALGLTQLMPSTAVSLGVAEPLDPAQSIEGGARYLSQLLRQFAGNTADALAAYNAGPGAVQQYGGVPPYAETQQYVTKVLGYAAAYGQGGVGGPLSMNATAIPPAESGAGGAPIATPSEAIA